jgi:hypothetical protein
LADSPVDAAILNMAVGTGTGQGPGENILAAFLFTKPSTTIVQTNNDIVHTCDYALAEAIGLLTEAGIMRTATVTTLMAYNGGINFNKTGADTLQIVWTISVN